jgi:hypothetical protein
MSIQYTYRFGEELRGIYLGYLPNLVQDKALGGGHSQNKRPPQLHLPGAPYSENALPLGLYLVALIFL